MGSCKVCGNRAESDYCFRHKPKKALKAGGRLKIKPKTVEQKQEQEEQWTKDREFYSKIWAKRPHYCQACGKYLGEELRSYMVDHLLEKSTYPQLRYEEGNTYLVCLEDHDSKTRGFPKPLHKEAIERAKEQFLNNK